MTAVLITHSHPENSSEAVAAAVRIAGELGVELVARPEEHDKHGEFAEGLGSVEAFPEKPDVCIVLGGDGSILYGLRQFADSGVPVFGINFGTVGFLAAAERDELEQGLKRALSGEFEQMDLPGLELGIDDSPVALNDVTFTRQPHGRVAELAYRIAGEEVGHVRCDGLVAATPAGSTGYNLANAGPILAWGVEGFVVSFIAPHTLTARALVVAPGDTLTVQNAAGRDPVEIEIDGDHFAQLPAGDEIEVSFRHGVARLAQMPGSNFYSRIREKFGRLAK